MSDPVLIEPAQLQKAMTTEPIVVIDTRDPSAYAKGHIPDAVNLRETLPPPKSPAGRARRR